jgi:hypothetical protein
MLRELLQRKKAAIGERWLDKTLSTYRSDTATFLKRQKDPFANPVGQTLNHGTRALLDELLDGMDPTSLRFHLEDIIKIRAIQDFSPSEAVSFVFLLKLAIREELALELEDPRIAAELLDFEIRIDQLALFAFETFTRCREKVFELRLGEIRRGTVRSMSESEPEPPANWHGNGSGAGAAVESPARGSGQ